MAPLKIVGLFHKFNKLDFFFMTNSFKINIIGIIVKELDIFMTNSFIINTIDIIVKELDIFMTNSFKINTIDITEKDYPLRD
jgi:hypothetical protein